MFTKGCEHPVIFNYPHNKSRCGECGAEFIKLETGERISLDDVAEIYQALKTIVDCYGVGTPPLQTIKNLEDFIGEARTALAKAKEKNRR